MQISHIEVRRHPIWQREVLHEHTVAKPPARSHGAAVLAFSVLAGTGAWILWLTQS